MYEVSLQAELWSVFIAIVRKSNRHLEACSEVGLICLVLDRLDQADVILAGMSDCGLAFFCTVAILLHFSTFHLGVALMRLADVCLLQTC